MICTARILQRFSTSALGIIVATICAAAVCNHCSAEEATYELKYKFEAGKFLYYEVENTTKMVSRFQQQTETMLNYTKTWKQLRVVSVDEQGQAMLEPMIERVQMYAKWDEKDPVLYDTGTDADPPLQFQAVKKTVGLVQAQFLVNAQGDLVSVTPLTKDDPILNEWAKAKDARLNFLVVLPKGPIRIGETWNDRFKSDVTVSKGLKQEVVLQRTYQLTEVKGNVATIKLKCGTIAAPVTDPQIELQLMQRTPSGVIKFDLERGVVLSMSTEINKQVINALGAQTSVDALTKSVDRLLPGPPDLKLVKRITEIAPK